MVKIIILFKAHFFQFVKMQATKSLSFFLLLIVLFPIIFNSAIFLVEEFYGGIFWFLIIIINILNLESLFKEDFELGLFHFLTRSHLSLEFYLFLKIVLYWLVNIVPVVFLGGFYILKSNENLQVVNFLNLSGFLAIHSFSLTLLTSIGAIFLLMKNQKIILIPLILIPLSIPLFIFGVQIITDFLLYDGVRDLINSMDLFVIFGSSSFFISTLPWFLGYLLKVNIK